MMNSTNKWRIGLDLLPEPAEDVTEGVDYDTLQECIEACRFDLEYRRERLDECEETLKEMEEQAAVLKSESK